MEQPMEKQNTSISASFLVRYYDMFLIENKEHFERFTNLKSKAKLPSSFFMNRSQNTCRKYYWDFLMKKKRSSA